MDTKTLYAKLATVPPPIKKWLGSDEVINMIDAMEFQFTLPSGSSGIIAKLMQKIQIKEIHPDYFSGDLASELNLDKDKAIHITGEIKKNIFLPIKNDLSKYGIDVDLLDKFQVQGVALLSADSPKIMQDVTVAPAIAGPTLPAVGWSQMKPPAPTPVPAKPLAAPAEPAPVILHEDTTFKAVQKNADFTLTRPGGGAEVRMGSGSAAPVPPRPAVIEFGGAAAKPVTPPSGATHYTDFKPALAATPMANAGPRNIAQVTPGTPAPRPAPAPMPTPTPAPAAMPSMSIPKPPAPPQPPQTPRPPQNPAPAQQQSPASAPTTPQNNKPIVKDFL